jgi:putative phage-type endonuclease
MSEIMQGSPEWYAARVGHVTASRVSDVIAKTKSGWSASRQNYMAELVAERLTGAPAERYQNAIMQRGTELEPDARIAYEFRTDAEVAEVGFVPHPTIAMTGASPDGLVGADGLIEIKCPLTATHIDSLLRGYIDEKYITQMTWQMACTGRAWCDFVSFDPRLPESTRLYVLRIERDDQMVAYLEKEVRSFLAEIDAKVAELNRLYPSRREAA